MTHLTSSACRWIPSEIAVGVEVAGFDVLAEVLSGIWIGRYLVEGIISRSSQDIPAASPLSTRKK